MDAPSSSSDDRSVTDVLAAALRGDDEPEAQRAFAELFHAHGDALIAFAFRYVRSMDAARDVAQEVFVRIWERRRDIPAHGLAAYLYRATRNRVLNMVEHDAVVAQWRAHVQSEHLNEGAADNGADRRIEAEELAARIDKALSTLAPRAREVVMLSREHGLKPGQIADVLRVAPSTVYVLLSRALKQLADALTD